MGERETASGVGTPVPKAESVLRKCVLGLAARCSVGSGLGLAPEIRKFRVVPELAQQEN